MTQFNLHALLETHFPNWITKEGNQRRIDSLRIEALSALHRLIESELSEEPTFHLRPRYFNDLCTLDFELNKIASELMASKLGEEIPPKSNCSAPRFFVSEPQVSGQDLVVEALMKDGYCTSPLSLNAEQLIELKSGLKRHRFRTKGYRPNELLGEELLECVRTGKSPSVDDGDTYWLEDMNGLAQTPLFAKLAFDPYIISIASRYLGCVPIHVQTNAWFSFPGGVSKNNLSMNGQLFHQDMEFIKFFKVFIYLNDVGEDQGPHCYVAGSHHDELQHKGVPVSERVTDADISRYYGQSRIKKLIGPAGSIVFGDTACVHKGVSVKSGARIMLQLEYASSLYLSPVSPFEDLIDPEGVLSQYTQEVARRLSLNYSANLREKFRLFSAQSNKKKTITKLKIIASRVKKRILG